MAGKLRPVVGNTEMKKILMKVVLLVAQSSFFTIIIGYLVFRSQWIVLPVFLAIATLMTFKCGNCHSSFQNNRVYNKLRLLKFYNTEILDQCPVCRMPMYSQHKPLE